MKLATLTVMLLAVVTSTGCVRGALATPAEDHYVQTSVVADACRSQGYGSGRCTEADLQAMVDQACLIDAVLKRKGAESCGVEEAGE